MTQNVIRQLCNLVGCEKVETYDEMVIIPADKDSYEATIGFELVENSLAPYDSMPITIVNEPYKVINGKIYYFVHSLAYIVTSEGVPCITLLLEDTNGEIVFGYIPSTNSAYNDIENSFTPLKPKKII